ncbi:MAG: hypothetical protein LBB74_03000 [Chitinispirillales bacterium]|jgi:hypothetical protein|nr:hypothetical protein [Chitinispirillales bacterium]
MESVRWFDPNDPVEEVYRVRKEIEREFGGDMAKYNEYLETQRPVYEAMGFKYVDHAV